MEGKENFSKFRFFFWMVWVMETAMEIISLLKYNFFFLIIYIYFLIIFLSYRFAPGYRNSRGGGFRGAGQAGAAPEGHGAAVGGA